MTADPKTPRGWFKTKPSKRGIYRTANVASVHVGNSYGHWDGERWVPHGKWFDYSKRPGFIWQGTGMRGRSAFRKAP